MKQTPSCLGSLVHPRIVHIPSRFITARPFFPYRSLAPPCCPAFPAASASPAVRRVLAAWRQREAVSASGEQGGEDATRKKGVQEPSVKTSGYLVLTEVHVHQLAIYLKLAPGQQRVNRPLFARARYTSQSGRRIYVV